MKVFICINIQFLNRRQGVLRGAACIAGEGGGKRPFTKDTPSINLTLTVERRAKN
jgi:hypothetical protein